MVERSRARQKNAAEGPPTASRGPMKNPSRERLQAELHLLRTQIVRLELQVNGLKETKRQERARVQDAAAVNALVNLSTPSWQLQVLSEQKKRRRVEQERGQLEHQINQQLHVISRLKRLLQKRMDTALPSSPCLPQGNSLWSLYGRFLQDIHVAYLMTDKVLEESTWEATSTRTTAVDCKTRLHLDEEQMYTEFRRQLWVPLPLVQASGKAWTSAANVFQTCHQVVVEFFSSEDRIAAQVYDSVSIDDVKTKYCVSTLIQLVKDIDRDVVVWRYVLTAVSGDYDQHQTTFSAQLDGTCLSQWRQVEPILESSSV